MSNVQTILAAISIVLAVVDVIKPNKRLCSVAVILLGLAVLLPK